MRNIMIVTNNEERMQGIIRAIEAMDTDHTIGIIYGGHDSTVGEVQHIMAELANAKLVITPDVQIAEVPNGKAAKVHTLELPENIQDRTKVIDYITNTYPNLIEELSE